MRNFNVVKIDSKGRILVPFHIRNHLNLNEGQEMIVNDKEGKELIIFPLVKGNSAKIQVYIDDSPGSLSKVMETISGNNVDIITSISKTIERGKMAEWSAILDTSRCNGQLKTTIKKLRSMKNVKRLDIEEK